MTKKASRKASISTISDLLLSTNLIQVPIGKRPILRNESGDKLDPGRYHGSYIGWIPLGSLAGQFRMNNLYALRSALAAAACALALWPQASGADLRKKTTAAFKKYVAVTEERMGEELKREGKFLYPDHPPAVPSEEMKDAGARLKRGE